MIEENPYYSVAAISNSSLAKINPEQGGSPAKFKKEILDRDVEDAPKPSFENGKIIHKYVEDPNNFVVSDLTKPSDMMVAWVERAFASFPETITATNFYDQISLIKEVALYVREGAYSKMKDETVTEKFWKEGSDYISYLFLEKSDKIILSPSQQDKIFGAVESIENCPGAYNLLFKEPEFGSTEIQKNEEPIMWERKVYVPDIEEPFSMNMKSLIDRFTLKFVDKVAKVKLIDFKTTSRPILTFPTYFESYRYYRQLAFYREAIVNYIYQNFPDFKGSIDFDYYMVVVETTGQYECKVFKPADDWIREGNAEMESLLIEIGYHQATGQWDRTREEVERGYIELSAKLI